MFRSLHVRNYRYYFTGQLISSIGTWVQTVAQGWLVLRLSHENGSSLGIVVSLQYIPMLVMGAWAGVLADRMSKRKLLLITQLVEGSFAALLATLTVTHVVELWMVYLISFLLGTATAFDMPARQAFAAELVSSEDITNAVSLNSTIQNLSRIIGPAIAGIVIAISGLGVCFYLNAASFLAAFVGLWMIRPAELYATPRIARGKRQIRAGFVYAWETPDLRRIFFVMAFVGTFCFGSFIILGPLLAKIAFHGDAGTYSALSSALGIGSLLGSLLVATRPAPTNNLLYGSCTGMGVLVLITAAAPSLWLALPALAATGVVFMVFLSMMTSTLQLVSAPEMRGRVNSLWALLSMGTTPVGGPLIGYIASHAGPRAAYSLGGWAALFAGVLAWSTVMGRRHREITAYADSPAPPEPATVRA
jgi:MFS family permease